MEAETAVKKKSREPVVVTTGWCVVLTRPGQVNSRITICGLTEEEASKRLARAPRDDAQRFAIHIDAVLPPSA